MGKALETAKAAGIPVLTWDSDLLDEGQGAAHRLCRHQELRHRRQPRQARAGDQAARAARSASSPAAPRRPTTTSACRASATRWPACRAPRPPGDAPDRPERLDRGRRLPALHQRRLPARRCSRWRTSSASTRTSTPSSRPAASRSSCPRPTPRSPRSTRRGSTSGELALVVADTLPVQMDLMKEGLSLGQVGQRPFEMGYKTMGFLYEIGPRRRCRPTRPIPASTSARPRPPTPASAADAATETCHGAPGVSPGGALALGESPMTQHTLRAGELELVVDAARGGSIMAFRQGGFDLMRPWDGVGEDPRAYASFPLVPFSGRVDHARFRFAGRELQAGRQLPARTPRDPRRRLDLALADRHRERDQRRDRAGPRRAGRRRCATGRPRSSGSIPTGSRSR